jgi:hypothetical protein
MVFAVVVYVCVWFEGFLVSRFAVLPVMRFIWAGGILPWEGINKSGVLPITGFSGIFSIF